MLSPKADAAPILACPFLTGRLSPCIAALSQEKAEMIMIQASGLSQHQIAQVALHALPVRPFWKRWATAVAKARPNSEADDAQ